MQKANKLSRHCLFNLAKTIAGISLSSFGASLKPPASPSLIIACLQGSWSNKNINKAVNEFIGLHLSKLAYFFIENKPLKRQITRGKNK